MVCNKPKMEVLNLRQFRHEKTYLSIKPFYYIDAIVDSQNSAVQCDMVVLSMPPFHIGIKPVIGGTSLVFVL